MYFPSDLQNRLSETHLVLQGKASVGDLKEKLKECYSEEDETDILLYSFYSGEVKRHPNKTLVEDLPENIAAVPYTVDQDERKNCFILACRFFQTKKRMYLFESRDEICPPKIFIMN